MKKDAEARKVEAWTITHEMRIGRKSVVFGENATDPKKERYICGFYEENGLFGMYSECMGSNDYMEIMSLYIDRLKEQMEKVRGELERITVPLAPITAEQCYKNDLSQSIVDKIVAIRADILLPEYQSAPHQLVLVTGGFGAHANARGTTVFATKLYDGEATAYKRLDVQGEVKTEHLPAWAQERAAHIREKEKSGHEPER